MYANNYVAIKKNTIKLDIYVCFIDKSLILLHIFFFILKTFVYLFLCSFFFQTPQDGTVHKGWTGREGGWRLSVRALCTGSTVHQGNTLPG